MIAHEIQRAPLYDCVFTCDKSCERIYKKFNRNTFYLPTAYNSNYDWDSELKRWERIIYTPDVFFVGSEVPGRLEFLKNLVRLISGKVNFRLFGTFPSIGRGEAPELEPFYIPKILKKFEVIKYYRGAKIVLNHFRTNESKKIVVDRRTKEERVEEIPPYSLNPRIYEILAAGGGLLLTDYRPELDEYFEIGKDLDVYKDEEDLSKKIEYYLEHEEERRKIAESGREKVVEKHSYIQRVKKMLSILEGVI